MARTNAIRQQRQAIDFHDNVGLQPGTLEDRAQGRAQAVLCAGHHQRQRGDLLQRQRFTPFGAHQRGGDECKQPLGQQRPHIQPRARFCLEQHRKVKVPGVELVHQVARQHLHQVQADVGVAFTHLVDQRQAQHRRCSRRQAHADIAAHAAALRGQHSMLCLAQGQARVVLEGQARSSRRHAGARARQQPGTDLAFQLRQLLAQCRSTDTKLDRSPAKAAVLQNTQEIAKLT